MLRQDSFFSEPEADSEIRIVYPMRASKSVLWQACASSQGLAGWQADSVEGDPLRDGRVVLRFPAFALSTPLLVTDVRPEDELTFVNQAQRVTFKVENNQLQLRHAGLQPSDDRVGLESSWRVALAHLSHGLEYHQDRSRHTTWFVGKVGAECELLHTFFCDAHCLHAWLTKELPGASLGEPGSRYSLALPDTTLRGTVLANFGRRDVAISCDDQAGSLLTMRTIPLSASERYVALVWSDWRAPGASIPSLEPRLQRLLQVLASRGSS